MKKEKIINYYYIVFPVLLQSALFFLSKLIQREPYNITTEFDKSIPYVPFFILFYVFWYALLFLAPIIIIKFDNKTIKNYFTTYIMCSITSTIIYVTFPTIIVRQTNLSNNFFDTIVKFIYSVDTPAVNCFPSFHVILCLLWIRFICLNKNINKSLRCILFIINICIILSTLFIKQHVLIDLLGSVVVIILVEIIKKLLKRK